ncbi:MAG: ABC transporter permease [Actinomycetota bacterium]|nr:ABC transporter permease [Actinomycetota bacterium]
MKGVFVRHAALTFGRTARHALREPAWAFVFPAVLPLALVAIITQVFGVMVALPGYGTDQLVDFATPGLVFVAAMMGGGFAAGRLVTDATNGYLDRLRLLPTSPAAALAGLLAFEAARAVPIAALLLLVGALLGAPLGSPAGVAVVLALVALWSAAWNALFLVAGLRTRSAEVTQALLPLFLPFMFTSSIWVPHTAMPGYIRELAERNPLDLLTVAARPLLLDGHLAAGRLAVAAGVAAGVLSVLAWVASRQLARLVTAD